MRFPRWTAATIALGLCGLTAGSVASAAPAPVPPDPPQQLVVGTLDGPADTVKDRIALRVRSDTTVRTFQLTYPVGSNSGWHEHPGIVLAVVESGTVIRSVGCSSQKFTAGQAFTEAAPHKVFNYYRSEQTPGARPAVLRITQLFPKGATELRVPVPPPDCS